MWGEEDARPGAAPNLHELPAFRCSLYFFRRRAFLLRKPARHLGEDSSQIDQTHGHPHEQPSDLLISLRRETPARANGLQHPVRVVWLHRVNRTNRDGRECDDYPEDTAGKARGE